MLTSYFANIRKKGNRIDFIINDVDVGVVNSLRRTILAEIPNIGFEHDIYKIGDDARINIIKNTTSINNEILKQRLSLVPINLDPEDILNYDEDKYKFVIDKSNTTEFAIEVTTQDINIYKNGKMIDKDSMESIFPSNPDYIPLTILKPDIINKENGDELKIEMRANIDIPQNFAGYRIVSVCSFINVVDEHKADAALREILKKFESEYEGTDLKQELYYAKSDFNTITRQKYYSKNEFGEPNSFAFFLESEYHTVPCEYLIFKGLDILINKINNVIENFVSNIIKPVKLKDTQLFDIQIDGETDTLGNLLQTLLYNYYIRQNNKKEIKFIGYKVPHPLQKSVIIRIEMVENMDIDDVRALLIDESLPKVSRFLVKLIKNWISINKNIHKYSDVSKYL